MRFARRLTVPLFSLALALLWLFSPTGAHAQEPAPTPTPGYLHEVTLPSGGSFLFVHQVTYGELMLAGLLLAMIGIFLVVEFVHSREAK